MKQIDCKDYSIFINDWDALNNFVANGDYSSVFVLVDEHTFKHCLPTFMFNFDAKFDVIEIDSGETHKDIETCQGIWATLVDFGADRHSLMINLGGGVIGDMGGFVAATFMRGMDFMQLPTTLLSQVDASVGGKLGVDFGGLKNLIGLIQNPKGVFVFTSFLETLPVEHLRSGFAEVIKHGLIQDRAAFGEYIVIEDFENVDWSAIVCHSIEIKKSITEQDPKERGIRKILNFGHTLGHAIETYNLVTENPLLHGEAVAIGMVMEAHLSFQLDKLALSEVEKIRDGIYAIYGHHPNRIPTKDELIELMKKDKKNRKGTILFSLLGSIGNGSYNQEVTEMQIEKAVLFYINRI